MNDPRWQVVHVVANHEKRVAQHFDTRHVEYYLPLYSEPSMRTDRAKLLERPLFRGYVFVRPTPADRLRIISTPGVLRLLGRSNMQTVSEQEISAIRQGLATGYVLRPYSSIAVGTTVRVCRGAFYGVTGIVTELRRKCNVVIRLSAIEQCFSLELPSEELELVKTSLYPAGQGLTPAISPVWNSYE